MGSVNDLVKVLQDAIERRYKSAENLSRQAGLSPGTVRNILKAGSGSAESLIKLGPLVGKTTEQMFMMAGWLPEKPAAMSPEAEEAARLIEGHDPEMRRVLVSVLHSVAQGLQSQELRIAAIEHLLGVSRQEESA